MSEALEHLAEDVGVSERTLRRACSLGTIRGRRPMPHTLVMSLDERRYVRSHWPALSSLRSALRVEPAVSLAVLFGSVARGEDDADSDVDLLIALRNGDRHGDQGGGDLRAGVMLTRRMRERTGLPVETVRLEDAFSRPSLLVEVLRDGRVLVDRDGLWAELLGRASEIREQSSQERRLRASKARRATEAFRVRAGAEPM